MRNKVSKEDAISYILEHYKYDKETSFFYWVKPTSCRVSVGDRAGFMYGKGYRAVKICGKTIYEHRVVWLIETGDWPLEDVDHINRVRSDNKFSNLREASRSENKQNQKGAYPTNKNSGLLGVYRQPNDTWQARVVVCGKTICLGTYKDKLKAHAVSMEYRKKLHPYSPLNSESQ